MLLRGYLRTALTRGVSVSGCSASAIFLLALTLCGCRQSAREPVMLNTFLPGWSQPDEFPADEALSRQFTQTTGIHVNNLPVPENTLDMLNVSSKLLQEGNSGPDVLGIDLIWSGALEGDLIDLRPYLASVISSLEPQFVPGYVQGGKVVAVPYLVTVGVLEYRTDLLREYGYKSPPKTWNELERIAQRIQEGERAKGKKDFWGYVWQGAAAEPLTCNALEWQASEGGGRIIENDRTISVNNPATIRAWQRARRWIGWISPPSVVAYRERDTMNVFDSGGAAFARVWFGTTPTIINSGQSRLLQRRSSLPVDKTGYTSIPGGPGGSAGVLGVSGLAVSRHSAHPKEAIELVRFLIRAKIQSSNKEESASDNQPEIYNLPWVSDPQDHSRKSIQDRSGIVNRTSFEAGSRYEQVSGAYLSSVHAVLTGEKGAPEAAAELEKQLITLTGFRTGPPKTD